ncbi:uncharacterized protein LOC113228206 isoform X1 [Hyposmocoma kahamanoa]|uniref:uncharacterized protein LOC113228206 isoform X1 n=1 Tax=Hyposmocoma kahamanoa TaxID=1477025 RepID=UPI000E6D89A7|nr:uncharacterized protein LOC113228206 isoform X1 [Hyposmocoma kahamanoa]
MPVKSVSAKPTPEKGVEKKVAKNVVDKSGKSTPSVDNKVQDKIAVLGKYKSKSITDQCNKNATNGVVDKNKMVKPSDKNAPEKGALDNTLPEKSEKPDKETLKRILMEKLNPDYDDITEEDWPAKTVNELEVFKQCENDEPEIPFGQVLLVCCCPDGNNNNAVKNGEMSEPYMWKEQIHTLMKGGESESDISDSEHFLTKGAFLITPSHGLSMEKASTICEKMEFKGCFSLTKTATGILFKFSNVDDYQMVFKKGFHKVTGSRFYRKIAIPCRPQKTFTIYVYDIPDEVPEEDVRHALYKFTSIVEVIRLHFSGSSREGTSTPKSSLDKTSPRALTTIDGELVSSMIPKEANSVIRVTLANIEEANILLQNGLDFYGATFFPTELATPGQAAKLIKPSKVTGGTVSARVRDLLPVFDQQGFSKFAPPASRIVKPTRAK